jgi:DNA-binding NtrC family response regulator
MSRKTLVVADADAKRVARLTPTLMLRGYSVIRVSTGEAVVQICSKTHIGLVLTQVLLPDTNGIRLSERLTQVAPDTRCLLISDIDKELIIRLPGCETLRSQFVPDPTSPGLIVDYIAAALKPRSMSAGG